MNALLTSVLDGCAPSALRVTHWVGGWMTGRWVWTLSRENLFPPPGNQIERELTSCARISSSKIYIYIYILRERERESRQDYK
jgi:hypothetical protein